MSGRRAVLLFARGATREARLKGLNAGQNLFRYVERRIAAAVARFDDVDLVVVGQARVRGASHHLAQRGDGFDGRLHAAFDDTRALGYGAIVAVGVDTPELSHTDLARAFAALENGQVVLGPSTDGGVYLIGFGADADLPLARWQSEHVFEDLATAFESAVVLRRLADVDDRFDALRLAARPGEHRGYCLIAAGTLVEAHRETLPLPASVIRGIESIRGPPRA